MPCSHQNRIPILAIFHDPENVPLMRDENPEYEYICFDCGLIPWENQPAELACV